MLFTPGVGMFFLRQDEHAGASHWQRVAPQEKATNGARFWDYSFFTRQAANCQGVVIFRQGMR
jgi:hypothetical protein